MEKDGRLRIFLGWVRINKYDVLVLISSSPVLLFILRQIFKKHSDHRINDDDDDDDDSTTDVTCTWIPYRAHRFSRNRHPALFPSCSSTISSYHTASRDDTRPSVTGVESHPKGVFTTSDGTWNAECDLMDAGRCTGDTDGIVHRGVGTSFQEHHGVDGSGVPVSSEECGDGAVLCGCVGVSGVRDTGGKGAFLSLEV
jgi:hypothetical protein